MNTDIRKYFEFDEKDNDYYALIAAKDEDEAVDVYYEEVVGYDYDLKPVCKELPSPEAWRIFSKAEAENDEEITMEDLVWEFDECALLLISPDLL